MGGQLKVILYPGRGKWRDLAVVLPFLLLEQCKGGPGCYSEQVVVCRLLPSGQVLTALHMPFVLSFLKS